MTQELSISQRRRDALELVSRKGFMSLGELVEVLKVSDSTVRRDLEVLEQQGSIRRTHGGAVSLTEPPSSRLGFADRQSTAVQEKRAIAARIAAMIPPNQMVVIDGGTTCYEVARALAGRRISVVTNSVPIAALLVGQAQTEVTLVGGYLYPRTGVALGTAAEETLSTLRAAQLVMSCAAVNADGVFNVNEMIAAVERRMIAAADEVILAVDHTKFGRRSIAPVCRWSEVSVVVTDAGLAGAERDWLEQEGVKLIVAEPVE